MSAAGDAAEAATRRSYGRLLAHLAYQWRDLAAAEDALAGAFASALESWPRDGIPAAPEGWLLTVARRNLLQAHRRSRLAADPAVTLLLEGDPQAPDPPAVPDHRLNLMFVCAHPAIDPSVRAALMLQTVLGVEAQRIAAAFLVSPAAMAQRLVRSKQKIAQAGIGFEAPEGTELPSRLHGVLEAVYAAYALGWEGAADPLEGTEGADLAGEAVHLAQLCATLLPASAEAAGLHALLLSCEARRAARCGPGGAFVPLHEQDTRLWDRDLLRLANAELGRAARLADPGPFQLEAAIQGAHNHRAVAGSVPWAAIAGLYEQLVHCSPTVGARVGRAVALGEAHGPEAGLAALAQMAGTAGLEGYQPYWVAQGYLLGQAGQRERAAACYARAVGLTSSDSVRAYLQGRLDALRAPGAVSGG